MGDDRILCRIDPVLHDEALKRKACRTVIMNNREYRGYLYVNEKGIDTKEDFDYWIGLALDFNQHAKATSKKANRNAS